MAKGNMFQGMARGKVGDVVFYRADGEQISRVRNRHPKNPRTNAQLYQRAIMATIVQAYSAGAEIFDHSFQGKQVGMENMRTFLRRNMRILRAQVASDIDNGLALAKQVGHVVAPGAFSPVPVQNLVVSEGILSQTMFTITPASAGKDLKVSFPNVTGKTTPTKEWAEANGLIPGDIYTFVAFINNNGETTFSVDGATGNYGKQFACNFGWLRLTVKDELPTTGIDVVKIEEIFNIEQDGNVFASSIASKTLNGLSLSGATLFSSTGGAGVFGIIRSRDDEKVRSTCQLEPINDSTEYGIVSQYALQAWQQGAEKLGNSELILEGGNAGNPDAPAAGGGDDDDDNPPLGGD